MDDVYGVPQVEREMTHVWRTKKRYSERFGKQCRVLASQKRQLVVEFEDGFQTFAHSMEVRRGEEITAAKDTVKEHSEEIVIQGRLREPIDVPGLSVAIEVSWTDGRQFRATFLRRGNAMSRKWIAGGDAD